MEGGFLGGGGNLFENLGGGPRMRFRRDAEEDSGGVVEDIKEFEHNVEEKFEEIEQEAEEAIAPVAETLHVKPW